MGNGVACRAGEEGPAHTPSLPAQFRTRSSQEYVALDGSALSDSVVRTREGRRQEMQMSNGYGEMQSTLQSLSPHFRTECRLRKAQACARDTRGLEMQ